MRRLAILCLLSSAGLADRLVEVAATQFVGSQVDIAAIAVPDGYLPSLASQREANRGHWRSVGLNLATPDETKFDGVVAGLERHGGGVVLALRRGDEIKAVQFHYEGNFSRSSDLGSVSIAGLGNTRLLRVASLRDGPLFVLAHDGGMTFGVAKPRGRGRADVIPGLGDALAATQPVVLGRDGRLSVFVVAPGRIAQVTQNGEAFALGGQHAFAAPGFVPRAIAVEGRELWVAGEAAGRATLLRFDARSPGAPPVAMDLGAGALEKAVFLDATELAVAGSKDGRGWVGVVGIGARPAVVHEAFVKGTTVAALGMNPARKGWSLCAASPDGNVSLLRLPHDLALPRAWDPFTPPAPAPAPEPAPVPEPEQLPEAVPPIEARGGGPRAAVAILPRAQATKSGIDTEIVLINLGPRAQQVFVRCIADEGRGAFQRVTIEPGKRATLYVAALVRRRFGRDAQSDFDGYVRIDGGDRDTLVVDAVIRRGGGAEEVRPHWR